MCQLNSGSPAHVSDHGVWVPERAKLPRGLCHPQWGVPATEMGKEVEEPQGRIQKQYCTLEQTGTDWEWGLSPLHRELSTNTTLHNSLLSETLLNLFIFAQTCPPLLDLLTWIGLHKRNTGWTVQYTASIRQSCAAETSKGLPSNNLGVNNCFFLQFRQW